MIFKKKANAKINLLLDLRCSLPDGYHSIFTCMQSVSLADTLLLEPLDSGEIILSCSEPSVPCDGRNSCAKAAKLFLDSAGIATGVHIRIEKYIPTQAGLAGGSADAAAVLSALSEAYPGKLSQKQLFEIALKVGADVPFCLHGGTALCQNKGEIISPLPDFESFVLIVKPDFSISTAQAYKNFDMMKEPEHPDNEHFLYYAAQGDYKNALTFSANVFEKVNYSESIILFCWNSSHCCICTS